MISDEKPVHEIEAPPFRTAFLPTYSMNLRQPFPKSLHFNRTFMENAPLIKGLWPHLDDVLTKIAIKPYGFYLFLTVKKPSRHGKMPVFDTSSQDFPCSRPWFSVKMAILTKIVVNGNVGRAMIYQYSQSLRSCGVHRCSAPMAHAHGRGRNPLIINLPCRLGIHHRNHTVRACVNQI